jgi:hypothetical protein
MDTLSTQLSAVVEMLARECWAEKNRVTMVKTFALPHCKGDTLTVQSKGTLAPGTFGLG